MFKIVNETRGFEAHISAELANIDKIEQATRNFLASQVSSDLLFNILLVQREALNNAVFHGCDLDNKKTVRFALKKEAGCITMEIEDEGKGFDWNSVFFLPCDWTDILKLTRHLPQIQHNLPLTAPLFL